MRARTVRLDEKTERILEELALETGLAVSDLLRRGILALREQTEHSAIRRPWEVYRQLDLGPGGYANVPSTETRRGVREALARKRRR